jgi:hypothetical protein
VIVPEESKLMILFKIPVLLLINIGLLIKKMIQIRLIIILKTIKKMILNTLQDYFSVLTSIG